MSMFRRRRMRIGRVVQHLTDKEWKPSRYALVQFVLPRVRPLLRLGHALRELRNKESRR